MPAIATQASGLRFKIEDLPSALPEVGQGTFPFFTGWGFPNDKTVQGFRVSLGSLSQDYPHPHLPRFDISYGLGKFSQDRAYRAAASGFILRFPLKENVTEAVLRIEARISKQPNVTILEVPL